MGEIYVCPSLKKSLFPSPINCNFCKKQSSVTDCGSGPSKWGQGLWIIWKAHTMCSRPYLDKLYFNLKVVNTNTRFISHYKLKKKDYFMSHPP